MDKFIEAQRKKAGQEDTVLISDAQQVEAQMQQYQQRLQQIAVARIEIAGFLKRSEQPETISEIEEPKPIIR